MFDLAGTSWISQEFDVPSAHTLWLPPCLLLSLLWECGSSLVQSASENTAMQGLSEALGPRQDRTPAFQSPFIPLEYTG